MFRLVRTGPVKIGFRTFLVPVEQVADGQGKLRTELPRSGKASDGASASRESFGHCRKLAGKALKGKSSECASKSSGWNCTVLFNF